MISRKGRWTLLYHAITRPILAYMSSGYENLSVVVMARDAAEELGPCLDSVRDAGDIVVADTGSADTTPQLAADKGARVVSLPWEGFGKTRAAAFALAEKKWILWLDSDERVTPELWDSLGKTLEGESNAVDGYEVHRRANFMGRWMKGGGWGTDWVLRIFRRDAYSVEEREVHEAVAIAGRIERLEGELLHYTDPTLSRYLGKFNTYTSLAAYDMHAAGRRCTICDLVTRPPWTFLRMYIVKGGFRDGIPGLVLAGLSGAYVFVKYTKLWELNRGAGKERDE